MKTGTKRATGIAAAALVAALGFAGVTRAATETVKVAPVETTVTTTTTYSGMPTWEVQGRVLAMSTTDRSIVLDDGSVLQVADVHVVPRDFDNRALIRATYEDRGAMLVVTSLIVEDQEVQAP